VASDEQGRQDKQGRRDKQGQAAAPGRGSRQGPSPVSSSGAAGTEPPYPAYALLLTLFMSGLGATAVRARRGLPANSQRTALELLVLALASFKVARTIARDEVTSFIREPFVEEVAGEEQPVAGGLRQAIGELVTCSRCLGTWAAAGIVAGDTFAPRLTKSFSLALALAALNDWLQAGFALLTEAANRLKA
jgi:hypothetical protein